MENTQQSPTQEANSADLSAQKMTVPSAFTGSDVSMTEGQNAGGAIVTTETGSSSN